MGPATSARFSLPQSNSTNVKANGKVVPNNQVRLEVGAGLTRYITWATTSNTRLEDVCRAVDCQWDTPCNEFAGHNYRILRVDEG